ncbi:MAG: hypothetical protein KAH84_02785 [Thiomargarita sp.]|nr:hypothetical protein [Thiomargarita sp.]
MKIADFNGSEIWAIRTTLKDRYGKSIELQLADSELKLKKQSEPVWCPTVYWEVESVGFVVIKTDEDRYQCQFFYGEDQYGTGIEEYDNIPECVTTLLQVQADFELQKNSQAN